MHNSIIYLLYLSYFLFAIVLLQLLQLPHLHFYSSITYNYITHKQPTLLYTPPQ